MAFTFKFNYKESDLEKACADYKDIELISTNETCKSYIMRYRNSATIGITKYPKYYRLEDIDFMGIVRNWMTCSWNGNSITIHEAWYNGRMYKSERYLKGYAQSAMRVFALVNCNKVG